MASSNDDQNYQVQVYLDQAYAEERRKLEEVVQHITESHIELLGQMPATAAYQEPAEGIQRILEQNRDSLYAALDQPYFGRLDYFETNQGPRLDDDESGSPETPKTIYLGITFIQGKDVFSWTSPVARLWYTQSFEDGYTAPKGYVATRVDLKRYLRIREQHLEEVNDVFRRQLPVGDTTRHDILSKALSGTGSEDGHLQIIVETIEPEQYENIANVSDKVLIVQGAAGSGKSEIGLHRIAYLLSPHSDVPERERPTPGTTLFIGPSQAFLEYAADILPTLGVQQSIQEARFSNWLMNQMSERVQVQPRIWNDLLNKGDMRGFNEQAETFKGSLAMASVVERHVKGLARETRSRCLDLDPFRDDDVGVTLPKGQISSLVDEVLPRAYEGHELNLRRQAFLNRMTSLVWSKDQGARNLRGREAAQHRNQIQERVSAWCGDAWTRADFRREYVSLLSEPGNIVQAAKDDLTLEDAEAMAEYANQMPRRGFGDSDAGGLAYLDHLLNGTIQNTYRHIVVDEAQDISPIEFKLLAASSTNNWFTILGDTAQRLTPYRGVKSWRDIESVFGRSEIARQRARRSYRSNKHITLFNNRILRTFDKSIPVPLPFERDGHRVRFTRHSRRSDMFGAVLDEIKHIPSMDDLENAVVGILARDTDNLNRFLEFCERSGASGIARASQQHHTKSRTVVARIPDAKGLEYDAVIVIGVNESFADTTFNKKLLYLATTRAKNYLSIHWSGQQSPILKAISARGVIWHRE